MFRNQKELYEEFLFFFLHLKVWLDTFLVLSLHAILLPLLVLKRLFSLTFLLPLLILDCYQHLKQSLHCHFSLFLQANSVIANTIINQTNHLFITITIFYIHYYSISYLYIIQQLSFLGTTSTTTTTKKINNYIFI